ncbi:MAG TPA: hypothetical protein VH834_13220 [Solirubrobacteraceae bacterium]|jgi:hypothetical protein
MTPHSNKPEPAEPHASDLADKLSHVRPIAHDEDERQSRADRDAYHSPLQSLFAPVPLPKWLKPRKPKQRF